MWLVIVFDIYLCIPSNVIDPYIYRIEGRALRIGTKQIQHSIERYEMSGGKSTGDYSIFNCVFVLYFISGESNKHVSYPVGIP